MLEFESTELRNEFVEAIQAWERITKLKYEDCAVDQIPNPLGGGFDPSAYDDWLITRETSLSVNYYLPERWDDEANELPVATLGEFIDLVKEINDTKLFKSLGCLTSRRLLMRAWGERELEERLATELTEEGMQLDESRQEELRKVLADISRLRKQFDDQEYRALSSTPDGDLRKSTAYSSLDDAEEARDAILRGHGEYPARYFPSGFVADGIRGICSLTRGATLYGLVLKIHARFEDRLPVVGDTDLFVEIRYEGKPTEDILENVLQAFLFETECSVGVKLEIVPIRASRTTSESNRINMRHVRHLRPLLVGKGLTEPLKLFNEAIAQNDSNVRLLYFTKVVEYVGQTVIRQNFLATVRAKLLSPAALDPDASFIAELAGVMEEQRQLARDREAVKLTVKTCCDATELAKLAPACLGDLRRVTAATKRKELDQALDKLGDCIADTRNSIAHAKANYTVTGNECPATQIDEFASCLELVAQQIIRWYGSQHDAGRVV